MQPTAIGPYTVVRLLGQGGMGSVYEVTHPEFPRALALKVLKGDLTPDALARFGREAELLAKIRHPGVVAIHSLGRTSSEDPYLVTDLVEGQELQELTRVRRLEARRCAELVRDLAAALEVVHAAGVVHRDLKPANVIVTPSGAPVLLDFGVARGAGTETLTQTGVVVGTVTYMSPEQAAATGPLDARTDVYSLGAILFFLLTGLPPYPGSKLEVLTALVRPNLAVPDPRDHDPQIPRELAELCRRALARSPQDRTPTAAVLREELRDWLAKDLAPPPPGQGRLLALVTGLLALLFGLGGIAAWALSEARPSPPAGSPAPDAAPSPPASAAPPTLHSSPDDISRGNASLELDRLERIWNHAQERPQERGQEPIDRPSPDPTFPEDSLHVELEAWLAANSDHPQAPRAESLSLAARSSLPIRVFQHGPVSHSENSSFHFFSEGGRSQLLARTWRRPELARWETQTWEPLPALSLRRPGGPLFHDMPDASLILPPEGGEGRRVLLGGRFGLPPTARLAEVERGALYEITLTSGSLRRIPLPTSARWVRSLARSPSGRIAVGTGRRKRKGEVIDPGSVHLLDPSGALLRSWELGTSVVNLAFPQDDLVLGSLREDLKPGEDEGLSTLVRWRGRGLELERLTLHLRTSGFHVTERELLVGGAGGELLAFSLLGPWAAPNDPPRRAGPGVQVAPLNAFALRGEILFAGSGGTEPRTPPGTRDIVLWRRDGRRFVQKRLIQRPTPILCLALSPEGRYLASRGRRDRIEIWDAKALVGE